MNTVNRIRRHRDLSELSDLLAARSTPAAAKPKKQKQEGMRKIAHTPANDNKRIRDVLAWPALERLAHRGDYRRVYALRHWRNMCYPDRVQVEPASDEYNPEVVIEVKPSEVALLAAVGWKVVDKERWHFTGEEVNVYEPAAIEISYSTNQNGDREAGTGDLLFRNGELIQWGRTKKGAVLKPMENARDEKGGTKPARTETALRSYLALSGAVSPLTARPFRKPMSKEAVIGEAFQPLPGTQEAREILRSFGVDGSVPFEKLPGTAMMCPDGLLLGPQWVGGVKKPKPLGEISAAALSVNEPVRQIETASHLKTMRQSLRQHAEVLDLAITNVSARELGISMGAAPAYAEKRGPSLIEAAIDELIRLDEHAWGERQVKEQKIAA